MNDFAYVAIFIGFFALAALFVKACDLIVGPDEAELTVEGPGVAPGPEQPEQVAA